jgi:type II secretory pathway pseudopilin PulG
MPEQTPKKSNITLLIIILVIVLFALAVSLLLPNILLNKPSSEARAESDCKQIAMAITSYKDDYGILPFCGKTPITFEGKIMKILAGENPREKVYFASYGGKLINPWGNQYMLQLDTDYDGIITTQFGKVESDVAVWSATKGGDFAKSWD